MTIFERLHNHVRVVCVKCKLNSAIVADDDEGGYVPLLWKIGWNEYGGSVRKFVCPVCTKDLIRTWGVPYRKTRKMTQGPGYSAKDRKILDSSAAIEKARQFDPPSIN